jgi:CheY-like chemotaxis protein
LTGDPAPEQAPTTSPSSLNILVVDDNEPNRFAFESLLTKHGYSVFLAESGQKALELAYRFHFAVVLCDVRMPIMNGIEAAVLLRRNPFTRATPIIFISAYEETAVEAARSHLEGLVDYIFSPVNPEVLIWKVRTWADLYIKNEMLRRRAAQLSQAEEALYQFIQKTPVQDKDLREVEARLRTAVRSLMESLSERLGLPV